MTITVTQRVDDLANNLTIQIKEKSSYFEASSIAGDERTGV